MVKRVLFDCVDLVAGLREAGFVRMVGGVAMVVEQSGAVGAAEAAVVEDVLSAGEAEFSSW